VKDSDPNTTETSFIAQGGDPASAGRSEPGFRFENEFHPGLLFSGRGQLAMANAGYRTGFSFEDGQFVQGDWSATNSTQFFITDAQPRFLDFKHTVFGQLTRGWETFAKMLAVPRDASDKPTVPVTISSAVIEPNNQDAVLVLSAAAAGKSVITITVSDRKGGTATRTFTARAVDDEWNSRPFLISPGNGVVPKDLPFRIGAPAVDLEHDYLFRDLQVVGTSSGNGSVNQQGLVVPKAGYTGRCASASR
jgi:cyclophilin family peptidyl-prolyl cis-trans isomerase